MRKKREKNKSPAKDKPETRGRKKKPVSKTQEIKAFIEIGLGTSLRLVAEELGFTERGFRDRYKEELTISREYFRRYANTCLAKRLPKSDRLIELVMRTQFAWKDIDPVVMKSPISVFAVEEPPTTRKRGGE